jgi:hypothetical protein
MIPNQPADLPLLGGSVDLPGFRLVHQGGHRCSCTWSEVLRVRPETLTNVSSSNLPRSRMEACSSTTLVSNAMTAGT